MLTQTNPEPAPGRPYFNPLLLLSAFTTMQFIMNTFMNVVVSDATEDMSSNRHLSEFDVEVRSSTAQFEEFVLGFLDRVFAVVSFFFFLLSSSFCLTSASKELFVWVG